MGETPHDRVTRCPLAAAAVAPPVGCDDAAGQDGPFRLDALPGDLKSEVVQTGEGGQVRRGEGSVGHVEVFPMGSVRTSILGRPRPLSGHRHAGLGPTLHHTLDPEEPNNYAYTNDPVNGFDLDGNFGWGSVWNATKNFVKDNWQTIAVGVAIGLVCGATAGIGCAIAAGAAAGAAIGGASYALRVRGKITASGMVKAVAGGAVSGAVSGAMGAVGSKFFGLGIRKYGNPKASTLAHQLTIKEGVGKGDIIMGGFGKLKDPRLISKVWAKYEYTHRSLDGSHVTIHYLKHRYLPIYRQIKLK